MDQEVGTTSSTSKKAVLGILYVVVVFLMLFPFINTLNELLVKIFEPAIYLDTVQNVIIPYQVRIVRGVLYILRVPMEMGDPNATSITLNTTRGQIPVTVGWNCLGWQSLLIIFVTLITGLTGKYTLISKLEALIVGLLGTFLLNIFRLVVIYLLFFKSGTGLALVFHDYGSILLTVIWMIVFWYYTFNFVLNTQN